MCLGVLWFKKRVGGGGRLEQKSATTQHANHKHFNRRQYAFTDVGLPPSTQQWMRLLCPERLALDLKNSLLNLEKSWLNREKLAESREKLAESTEKFAESMKKLAGSREKLRESREKFAESTEKFAETRKNG